MRGFDKFDEKFRAIRFVQYTLVQERVSLYSQSMLFATNLIRCLLISILNELRVFDFLADWVESIGRVGIALTLVSVHTYSIGRGS